MDTFFRFLYEFLSQFFSGFILFFIGIKNGIISMFNIPKYISIVGFYKDDFNTPEWILVSIAIIILIAIVGGIIFLIYLIFINHIMEKPFNFIFLYSKKRSTFNYDDLRAKLKAKLPKVHFYLISVEDIEKEIKELPTKDIKMSKC